MTEADRIVDLSRRVITGEPWHAGSLADLLADVTATDAAAHPVPGAHSIWEIVLHMTGWIGEVRARIEGAEAGTPPAGDWPAVGKASDARWDEARDAFFAAADALEATIATIGPADLDRPVVDRRESESGEGASRYLSAHGIIHHSIYHAGQIALLKRALG
jgi:uncharacterized damage-inducible protein DinB